MKPFKLIFLSLIVLVFANGCSKKGDEPKTIDSVFIGDRLLNLAKDNPNNSPPTSSISKIFSDCTFSSDKEFQIIYSKDCSIANLDPNKPENQRQTVSITADDRGCCTESIHISKNSSDKGSSLDLFSNLKSVSKKMLQCSPSEPERIFLLEKNGQPMFIVVEYRHNDITTDTIIHFGKTQLDCDFLYAREKGFFRAQTEVLNNSQQQRETPNNFGISTASISAKEGSCFAYLTVYSALRPESFERLGKDFSAQQSAWIREQAKKGLRINEIVSQYSNLSNEEIFKKLNKSDAEWKYSNFITTEGIMATPQKGLSAQLALGYMAACAEAKFIPEFGK